MDKLQKRLKELNLQREKNIEKKQALEAKLIKEFRDNRIKEFRAAGISEPEIEDARTYSESLPRAEIYRPIDEINIIQSAVREDIRKVTVSISDKTIEQSNRLIEHAERKIEVARQNLSDAEDIKLKLVQAVEQAKFDRNLTPIAYVPHYKELENNSNRYNHPNIIAAMMAY